MNFDWNQLTTLEFWFEGFDPTVAGTTFIEVGSAEYWFWLYFFTTFIVGGICWKVYRAFLDFEHPIQKKIPFWSSSMIWFGIIGLSWFLAREFNFGFLGARIWLVPLAIFALTIVVMAIRYLRVYYGIEVQYYRKNIKNKKS